MRYSKYKYWNEKEPKEIYEKPVYLTIQEIVNKSEFYLMVHSAILYGLMSGPLPNQEKCLYYLEKGKRLSVMPQKGYICPEFMQCYSIDPTKLK